VGEHLVSSAQYPRSSTFNDRTRLATFYSRSRNERWCKGETSGHFIKVAQVFADCDKDSIIYLGDPIGPACHTGAK
jgi:phosphoribosyl-AMP cyclohydrolase